MTTFKVTIPVVLTLEVEASSSVQAYNVIHQEFDSTNWMDALADTHIALPDDGGDYMGYYATIKTAVVIDDEDQEYNKSAEELD